MIESPFYRRFYSEHGVSIEQIKDISDIAKLPSIDKHVIKKHIKDISLTEGRRVVNSYTGGTTMSALAFPETIKARILERSFIDRLHKWHGLSDSLPKIMFKGCSDPKPWFYNPFHKATIFPFWCISEELLIHYSRIVQHIKPVAIVSSYPSLIFAFAQAANQGLFVIPDSIHFIFCSSETILPYQIKEIERAFDTTPIDHYGQNEKVSMIQQCPYHAYHIIPEYGFTEILDESNNVLTEEGQMGEIVGTGFMNRSFPLIRYKTGDYAEIGQDNMCPCGVAYKQIRKLIGRSGDSLMTDNGKSFSPPIIEFAVDNSRHIKDVQLIQNSIDQVDVLLVPSSDYTKTDGDDFISVLTEKTNDRITFKLTVVEKIPRPNNFKKRLIISKLDAS